MSQSEPLQVIQVATEQVARNYAPLVRHLCVGMIDQAINVTVVTTTAKLEKLFVGPVNIIRYRPGRWFPNKAAFRSLIERISPAPHVVHALAADGARLSADLADHFKADLVLQVSGINDLHLYRTLKSKNIAAMPAFTEPLADRMAAGLKEKSSLVEVIRPGTHVLKGPTCLTAADQLPTLLIRCPLVADSGLNDVLEAVARLLREHRQLMLFILGTGPKESAYRRRANELKIGPHVTFAGEPREWIKILQGADIFIQPRPTSVFDVFPLEAMAAGMAAVTCAGGVEDFYHDDRTVLLASPVNPNGFYRCLRRLLDDPGFARTLAVNAQQYVQTHHPPSAMASAYAQLYRRLLLKRRTFPMKLSSDTG